MLRTASRSHIVSSNKLGVRRFSNSLLVLKEEAVITKPNAAVVKEVNVKQKKKFSFTKFLLRTAIITSIAYGGTLYASTKNEKVMDFVMDNQLPYHEELLDLIESGSLEELKNKLQVNANSLFSKNKFEEFTQKLEYKGGELFDETKKKFGGNEQEQKPFNVTDVTPAQQLEKQVEVESIKKDVETLPLIQLTTSSIDSSVQQTVDSFNRLIESIEATKTPSSEILIKAVNENVTSLANKLNSLTTTFDDELEDKLKVTRTELLSSFTKKELELTENLLHQFNHEKAQLEQRLSQTLGNEIEATKKTISQAAVNAVSMVRIEQTKNFEKMIKDKIDEERDGRLANLDKLNARLVELESFATSLESQLAGNHQKSLVHKSLSKLKSLFNSDESEKPRLIGPYLENLSKVSSETKDELFELALQDLQPLLSKESTKSILTTPQLLSRWELLAPELRSASLLPPNAGLLGHLSSIIFSKFLLPVKGARPDSKDIESVIGRVESSLARGELDVAIEEVANLKGWPRKLADDWVLEGRKRLEIEFLVDLIETEAKTL